MTPTQRLAAFIDSFYWKPFRALMPLQTFRYLACGGINWVVTTVCFWAAFNFLFAKQNIDLGFMIVASHTAALGVAWLISVGVGFWMQKNISFKSSPLRNHTQLFRYFLSNVVAALIAWLLEKLLVEQCHIFPTIAFTLTYLTTALLGFAVNKHFTFRGAEKE